MTCKETVATSLSTDVVLGKDCDGNPVKAGATLATCADLEKAKGQKGERGEKGDKGDKGEQGIAGRDGRDGIQGIQGVKGDRGEQGVKGDQGIAGRDGKDGRDGLQGERGYKGEKGDRGDTGLQGEKGEKGDRGDDGKSAYELWKAEGHTGTLNDFLEAFRGLKGEKGEKGRDGTSATSLPMKPLFDITGKKKLGYIHYDPAEEAELLVEEAGGAKGYLQFTMQWFDKTDVDLHVLEDLVGESTRQHIYYSNKTSPVTNGKLDVDKNAGAKVTNPVENITYTDLAKIKDGTYTMGVISLSYEAEGTSTEVNFIVTTRSELGGRPNAIAVFTALDHREFHGRAEGTPFNVAKVTKANGVYSIAYDKTKVSLVYSNGIQITETTGV